jgi:hypothetical protein
LGRVERLSRRCCVLRATHLARQSGEFMQQAFANIVRDV